MATPSLSRRLPPLNALRAFESVARHLSIKGAADEMLVTSAAITQQIKLLEDNLGRKLLYKAGRGVVLSDAGSRFFSSIHQSFSDIVMAVSELTWRDSGQISLSLPPSLAQRWLAAHLSGFRAAHPNLALRLVLSMNSVDFASEDIDMEIRWGGGTWPGMRSHLIMTNELFPVCSPSLLSYDRGSSEEELLLSNPLLHTLVGPTDWNDWMGRAGFNYNESHAAYRVENSALALEMAEHGVGIAISRAPFAISALVSGRLIAPFSYRLKTDNAYYLVYPDAYASRSEITVFRKWLLQEGSTTQQAISDYLDRHSA